jgi:Na+/H+ antiporter NhaC
MEQEECDNNNINIYYWFILCLLFVSIYWYTGINLCVLHR